MKLAIDLKGNITGWYCGIYNTYNDILNLHCKYCKVCKRPEDLTQLANQVRITRLGQHMSNDERDLFIKLFSQEKALVKDLDTVALRIRKNELRQVATEAKIRLTAIDDEERDRKEKLTPEQRQWLVKAEGNDPNVTDAISQVKERRTRMSKADKLAASLATLGLDDSDVKTMMANVERVQSGGSITSPPNRTLTFKPVRTEEETSETPKKIGGFFNKKA